MYVSWLNTSPIDTIFIWKTITVKEQEAPIKRNYTVILYWNNMKI
jgi:hypothetical protein